MSFERLFHPRGIAIIGASADLTRIGGHPIKALKGAGFKGGIFPVNPKYPELHGLKCYPDAAAISEPCDLAIVAVPAPAVAQAIRDCGKAKIPFAVVLTAGFRETGAEGRKLEDELKRAVAETGVRIVGPNCQGMLSLQSRVWAAFGSVADETDFRPGSVSCAFQSGGFGYAVVNLAEAQGLGFRYCVSSGNETDIDTPQLLSAFLDDPGTSAIFAYLEGTPDARRLLDVGRKSLETGKPVMIWKAATTEAGIKAAASHTANMTGRYDLYRAALRQAGLIEVDDVEPIVDIAKLFAQGRLPRGNAVGVLSISGGSGIVYADAAVRGGMSLPPFSDKTLAALRKNSAGVRLAGEPRRHHRRLLQRHAPFHRCAGDRAGRPRPRSALHPARLNLRGVGGQGVPRHRRGGGAHRQADPRRLVRPAGEIARGAEGADRGRRAAHDHAGAAGACRRDACPLRRRPTPPAAAPPARGAHAEGPRPARRRRDAERGGEQGGADRLRHSDSERSAGALRRRCRRCDQGAQCAVRGEDRLARHRPQDGSRRREARRRARGPRRRDPHRHRQRKQGGARRQDRRRAGLRDGAGR